MKERSKNFYNELGNKIYNVMVSKYTNITGFTKAGSREKGNFKRKSDLDIRFCMSGDPKRIIFYPKLEEYLSETLPDFNGENLRYEIGEEGNVIHVYPANGGKVDIALLTESEYNRQEGN